MTITLLTAALLSLLASCGSDQSDGGASDAAAFVDLARKTTHPFSLPKEDPKELLRAVDISIVGRVSSVEEGRTMGPLDEGPMHTIVVGLDTQEEFKVDDKRAGKLVYFEIARPDNITESDYQKALPKGTTIVLFGYNRDKPLFDPVTDNYSGREKDSTLYSPAFQGLFVATNDGLENVWGATKDAGGGHAWDGINSIDDLRKALQD